MGCSRSRSKASVWLYSFNDAKAAERHETQYFEMFGNRGIYHKGWTAVTRHRTPWLLFGEKIPAFDDDNWELYDTNKDWSQAKNLAEEMPEKLHELQRLWLIEATRYNVLPLDDRGAERFNSDLAGRPVLIKGNSQILFGSMGRLSENSRPQSQEQVSLGDRRDRCAHNRGRGRHRRSRRQHRRLEPLRQGRQAQILLQLARHPVLLRRIEQRAASGRPPGTHGVCLRWWWPWQGWHGVLVRGWQKSRARARVGATAPMIFSADDGCDVGVDTGAPVSPDYGSRGNEFSGRVKGVQLAIAEDAVSLDHLVSPEDAIRIAMARQ